MRDFPFGIHETFTNPGASLRTGKVKASGRPNGLNGHYLDVSEIRLEIGKECGLYTTNKSTLIGGRLLNLFTLKAKLKSMIVKP